MALILIEVHKDDNPPVQNPEETKMQEKSVERISQTSRILSQSEIMEDEENTYMPNAFLELDPKPVLNMLAEYS